MSDYKEFKSEIERRTRYCLTEQEGEAAMAYAKLALAESQMQSNQVEALKALLTSDRTMLSTYSKAIEKLEEIAFKE